MSRLLPLWLWMPLAFAVRTGSRPLAAAASTATRENLSAGRLQKALSAGSGRAQSWLLLLCMPLAAMGQTDSLPLDRDFRFADGLYRSFEALRANKPDLRAAYMDGRMVVLPEEYRLKVAQLYPKGRADLPVSHSDMYALVIDGLPYLHIGYDSLRQFSEFAGLRARGLLSYFQYDTTWVEQRVMTAYIPYTDRPFRQGSVSVEQRDTLHWVFDFTDGSRWLLSRDRLLARVAADAALYRTVAALPPDATFDDIYRCLLIYDDRHPLYLPVAK
jgi:hypothetical protein